MDPISGTNVKTFDSRQEVACLFVKIGDWKYSVDLRIKTADQAIGWFCKPLLEATVCRPPCFSRKNKR